MTRPDGALVPGQTVRHIKRGTMYTILARVEVPLDQMADEEIGWMTAEGLHGDDLPMEVAGPFIYRVMVQIDDMTRKSLAIARAQSASCLVYAPREDASSLQAAPFYFLRPEAEFTPDRFDVIGKSREGL